MISLDCWDLGKYQFFMDSNIVVTPIASQLALTGLQGARPIVLPQLAHLQAKEKQFGFLFFREN